jgi:hypothetical protein
MALITSLPPSWDNFIASIDFKDLMETDDKKRMAVVNSIISRIKGEANCCKLQNTSVMPTAFNSMKPRSNTYDSKSRPDKSNSECRYCQKKDHWIKECQKKIMDEKKRGVEKNANIMSNMEMACHHLHLEWICISEILGLVIPAWITI